LGKILREKKRKESLQENIKDTDVIMHDPEESNPITQNQKLLTNNSTPKNRDNENLFKEYTKESPKDRKESLVNISSKQNDSLFFL